MKRKSVLAGLLIVMMISLTGCITVNPEYTAETPEEPVEEVVTQEVPEEEEPAEEEQVEVTEEVAEEELQPDANVISKFVGSFGDSYSQRAHMDIVDNGDGTLSAEINWGSSAWDNSTWTMRGECKFVESIDNWAIVYTDGKEVDSTYYDDGTVTENVIYENACGMLYLDENDHILWQDDKYPDGKECVFEK